MSQPILFSNEWNMKIERDMLDTLSDHARFRPCHPNTMFPGVLVFRIRDFVVTMLSMNDISGDAKSIGYNDIMKFAMTATVLQIDRIVNDTTSITSRISRQDITINVSDIASDVNIRTAWLNTNKEKHSVAYSVKRDGYNRDEEVSVTIDNSKDESEHTSKTIQKNTYFQNAMTSNIKVWFDGNVISDVQQIMIANQDAIIATYSVDKVRPDQSISVGIDLRRGCDYETYYTVTSDGTMIKSVQYPYEKDLQSHFETDDDLARLFSLVNPQFNEMTTVKEILHL